MLNYNHLHYFHVAATEGSVAATAARLGVTQPTVSEQIRALEKVLGVTLFERTASGLRLTEVGRLAFEHTSVMFRAGERLIESLGHSPAQVPRSLRVGLSPSVARSATADFLMPLFALDDCVPSIRTGDAIELVRTLRAGELDLVLTDSAPPEDAMRGLESAELTSSVLVAVAPPNLEAGPAWENISILQYRASTSRWMVDDYLNEHGLRPRVAGEADDALFLVEAAARGGFVTFVPRSVARDAVTSGRLRVLGTIDSSQAAVYAVYQDGETANLARRAVTVLIEHVRSIID
ncbi:MAG TPA: LysR family transcriptional regulator [Kofleriaceae bacterium]|nr:LysR family transcriptional regulator [Kofleriaceae bacterium]